MPSNPWHACRTSPHGVATEASIAIVVVQAEIACRSFIDHGVVEVVTVVRVVERLTGHRSSTVGELSQEILVDFVDHAFVLDRRLKFAFEFCKDTTHEPGARG